MGNLLMLNFGTVAATARFKALALSTNFLSTDLMDKPTPPAGLIAPNHKMRKIKDMGTQVISFYGMTTSSWQGKIGDKLYKDVFKRWMVGVLSKPVHCLYLTGHHWDDHNKHNTMFISWGDLNTVFHAEFNTSSGTMAIGTGWKKHLLDMPTDQLLTDCKLVLGFGCNVCTGINSARYQKYFSAKGTRPVILGWNASIGLPKRSAAEKKLVNKRFFKYLTDFATAHGKVPAAERLAWFYDHEPMQLVNAWGYATTFWIRSRARARGADGIFYRFKMDKKKGYAVPVKDRKGGKK
jgi:hypothetical protein